MAILDRFYGFLDAYYSDYESALGDNYNNAEIKRRTAISLTQGNIRFLLLGRDGYFTLALEEYNIMLDTLGVSEGDSSRDVTEDDLKTFFGDGTSIPQAVQTLTEAATTTWNYTLGYNAALTLTGNRDLLITNVRNGDSGTIIITQGAGGNHTIELPGGSLGQGGPFTPSTEEGSMDILSFLYDGNIFYWNIGKGYAWGEI